MSKKQAKSKFYRSDGSLSEYALACGYVQTHKSVVGTNITNEARLDSQSRGLYDVVFYQWDGNNLNAKIGPFQTTRLVYARMMYDKIKSMINMRYSIEEIRASFNEFEAKLLKEIEMKG